MNITISLYPYILIKPYKNEESKDKTSTPASSKMELEPLFKLAGGISAKSKREPPFLFFVTDLTHQLTGKVLICLCRN